MGRYSLVEDNEPKKNRYSLVEDNDANTSEPNQDQNKSIYNENFYKEHPFIKQLGELIGKIPGLNTAAKYMEGSVNKPIESLGLPHAARGFFQGGENIIRGVGNLIPGINIPSAHINKMPIGGQEASQDSFLQNFMGLGGEVGSLGGPANKIFQGTEKVISPLVKSNAIKSILAGALSGSVLSPDERKMGALIGGGISALPQVYEAGKNAYEFANKSRNLKLSDLKQKLEEMGLNTENAEKLLQDAQKSAKSEYNVMNPESLEYKLKQKEKAQDIVKEKINNRPQSQLKPLELPEEPTLPQTHEYEPLHAKAQSLFKTNEQKLAKVEEEANNYLGHGQTHHERFAIEANKDIEKLNDENKANYTKVDEHLDKKKVAIKSPEDAKIVANHVSKILSENDIWSPEVSKLPAQVEEMNRSHEVLAKDYLKMYRGVRNAASEAYHRMVDLGGSSTEAGTVAYNHMIKLNEAKDKMYSLLNSSLPKEAQESLDKAQSFFRDVIAPMRKNRTINEIINKVKVTGNMREKLIGGEEGQDILQSIVGNNPELQRLVIGQEFAGKFKNIHEPNEHIENVFLPKMPKLRQLKEEHAQATKAVNESKEQVALAKEHDIEQETRAKEREKERENILKAHEKEKKQLIKEHEAYKKAHNKEQIEREELKAEHEANTKEMKDLKERIPDLKEKAENVKQSLKDKIKHQKEYDEAKRRFKLLKSISLKAAKASYKIAKKITTG